MKHNYGNEKMWLRKTDNGSPAMAPKAAVCFYTTHEKNA
jgi:hypothetical protein